MDGHTLDLIILVPGKDEKETLEGLLLKRRESLGISAVRYKILVHPRRDPGVFNEAAAVLQPYLRQARYALILLDHEGSGQEDRGQNDVRDDLLGRLHQAGWTERCAVILCEPELEMWVWSDSPHVDRILGWEHRSPGLRPWLTQQGLWPLGAAKPARPKEAFIDAVCKAGIQHSSSLFRELAEHVGLERCQDPSFSELSKILRRWFGR